jgi:Cu2+-exporting ATPase
MDHKENHKNHDKHNHGDKNHDHGGHGGHSHHDHHKMMIEDFKKRFWISLIITIPIVFLAPMIQELVGYEFRFEGDRYVQFGLSTIIFIYGGWPFLKGLIDEIKDKAPGMMTLIALAIFVAYLYSTAVVFGLDGKIFFWELATLIDIMLVGHWIEMKSVMGASNALEELAKMMPSEARRIKENGDTEDVEIGELENGNQILVRPGEKIPADGVITEGESHINESMLTGESKPVGKSKGDKVIAGSVNDNGTLKINVEGIGDDSYLSKVIKMVKEAQQTKLLADTCAFVIGIVAITYCTVAHGESQFFVCVC